jgi:hypothetical protein
MAQEMVDRDGVGTGPCVGVAASPAGWSQKERAREKPEATMQQGKTSSLRSY